MKKMKKIPHFTTEDQERDFWAKESPLDYVDMANRKSLSDIVNLEPKYISIRLPTNMILQLKSFAKKWDVGYQALIKLWLGERIQKEAYSA